MNDKAYIQQQFENLRQKCNADVNHLIAENAGLRNANTSLSNELTRTMAHYENSHLGQ